MHPIPAILEDLRAGKIIVLVDDEQRENEGDMVCAAQFATPQVINFMLRQARGMMCLALAEEICDRLALEPQGAVNTTQRGTAFTISIDAHERFGITTGVSAADRAATIKVAIDDATRPDDLARPGHMQPLRARAGGVLVRAGQTEGSVDLCLLAGLKPAAVIIEVMNDDGSMARLPDLQRMCQRADMKLCSVADVIQHRLHRQKLVQRIEEAPFDTEFGRFTIRAYRSVVDPLPHIALTCGDVGQLDAHGHPVEIDAPVLVRMHSQNLLGDIFGDLAQPSGKALRSAMRMLQREGRGALVYLRHDAMGTGLLQRLQSLHAHAGSPRDAHAFHPGASIPHPGLGLPPTDKNAYGIGSQILRDLGIRKLRLLTNHPFHPTALHGFGLEITEFVPISE